MFMRLARGGSAPAMQSVLRLKRIMLSWEGLEEYEADVIRMVRASV